MQNFMQTTLRLRDRGKKKDMFWSAALWTIGNYRLGWAVLDS